MPPNQKKLLLVGNLEQDIIADFGDGIVCNTNTTNLNKHGNITTETDYGRNCNQIDSSHKENDEDNRIRCAILGCGMMGQEHISYIMGYSDEIRLDYLCDPFKPSLEKSIKIMEKFYNNYSANWNNNSCEDENHYNCHSDSEQKIFSSEAFQSNEVKANDDNITHNNEKRNHPLKQVTLLQNETELLSHANEIDLLVIATPNYLHTDSLLKWCKYDITILVEKPVAVSYEQHEKLRSMMLQQQQQQQQEQQEEGRGGIRANNNNMIKARVWVAMEYRYIPAIAKLLDIVTTNNRIGELKMITIRENRYPFLHKIGSWNRSPNKTGDTLVEKCCHFFDLFRLITNQEIQIDKMRSIVQRGLNYQDEVVVHQYDDDDVRNSEETGLITTSKDLDPIIDSAYVVMPFKTVSSNKPTATTTTNTRSVTTTMGCLELCMYAEGSRHQEEIIVTGTKGRVEAYLPENKVYCFERPCAKTWNDRSVPPPPESIRQTIYDCSNLETVFDFDDDSSSDHDDCKCKNNKNSSNHQQSAKTTMKKKIPSHHGYHYSSTAIEWYRLLNAMEKYKKTGIFIPEVSLNDGLCAVEIGLKATDSIIE